jgi:hypothetical protein
MNNKIITSKEGDLLKTHSEPVPALPVLSSLIAIDKEGVIGLRISWNKHGWFNILDTSMILQALTMLSSSKDSSDFKPFLIHAKILLKVIVSYQK